MVLNSALLAGAFAAMVAPSPVVASDVPQNPNDVQPLSVGAQVPDAAVRRSDGTPVRLQALIGGRPAVLVFYRGGWCPYCNTHLGQLKTVEKDLLDLGYTIVAISPDRPEKLAESSAQRELGFTLISDSKMEASRAFGLAFQVDAETVAMYLEKYKIDLEGDSGEKHHQLPVPAAYVARADGTIAFAYHDVDYKQRVDPQALLAAARDALR